MGWNSSKDRHPTTANSEEIPSGQQYLYHVMPQNDVADVMTEGLRPFYRQKKWDILHAYLDRVASVRGFSKSPESRSNCIFCHDRKKYGINAAGDGNVTAVIDTDGLSNSIYKADRERATIVARALNEVGSTVLPKPEDRSDVLLDDVDNRDACRAYSNSIRYWNSCCSYGSDTDIDGITEVLIYSQIPRDSIVTFYTPD